jgi:hypothetical protein
MEKRVAIQDMMYRFTGNPTPAADMDVGKDKELEALIDKVGRKEVFSRARSLGWHSGEIPPKWVWNAICHDILHGRPSLRKTFTKRVDEMSADERLGTDTTVKD